MVIHQTVYKSFVTLISRASAPALAPAFKVRCCMLRCIVSLVLYCMVASVGTAICSPLCGALRSPICSPLYSLLSCTFCNPSSIAYASLNEPKYPAPFYGGLHVNEPLLEVGKYASLTVTAYDDHGNQVSPTIATTPTAAAPSQTANPNAVKFTGTLTLNIPMSEVLKATKAQMEAYSNEKAKLDFNYTLSLPEPISWTENPTVTNASSLVDSDSATATISPSHKNTITLAAQLKPNTWNALYSSTDNGILSLTAHFTFTKQDLERVKNNSITGTGILDLYKYNDGNPTPDFGQTYITHELALPLLGGGATITKPLDTTKQGFNQLIYSGALTKNSQNTKITTNKKFSFSGTVEKVTYEDYSAPLLTKDGVQINAKVGTAPIKDSIANVESWLKTKINDVSRVYVEGLNLSIKLTFKLPGAISLSERKDPLDNPSKHYPLKPGGVRNDPTSLLGTFDGFALKDVKEENNTITATAYLKDWYKGNQLLRPYAYSFDEIKQRINKLGEELQMRFIPVWFNSNAEAGKTYKIEGSAEGLLTGRVNYVYRQLGAYDTDKLIPFKVGFREDKIELDAQAPYTITFTHVSGTPGHVLPEYLSKQYALKPLRVYKGNSVAISNANLRTTDENEFDPWPEVVGDGTKKTGTWVFDTSAGWKIDGKGRPVTTIDNVNKNITLVGTWKFISVDDPSGASDYAGLYERCAMYRLYNPYTHEHLFTTDLSEKDNLVFLGWRFEGTVGYVGMHGEKGGVYRLYNPTTGEHHYTMKDDELALCTAAGWVNEGVKFFSVEDKDTQVTGMVSMYNPYEKKFYHHYTSDPDEIARMVKDGWRKEEIKWYAAPKK